MLYFNTNVGATLFRKALSDPSHPHPRVINTDQARLYGSAIPGVKKEGILRRRCRHRSAQYLNNILEQDHRAIKRRVKTKQGVQGATRLELNHGTWVILHDHGTTTMWGPPQV